MLNRHLLIGIPGLAGALLGAVKGAYDGYNSSKNEHLVYNYYNTLGGLIVGTSAGLLLGSSWFISAPIFVARTMNGTPFDGVDKEALRVK